MQVADEDVQHGIWSNKKDTYICFRVSKCNESSSSTIKTGEIVTYPTNRKRCMMNGVNNTIFLV